MCHHHYLNHQRKHYLTQSLYIRSDIVFISYSNTNLFDDVTLLWSTIWANNNHIMQLRNHKEYPLIFEFGQMMVPYAIQTASNSFRPNVIFLRWLIKGVPLGFISRLGQSSTQQSWFWIVSPWQLVLELGLMCITASLVMCSPYWGIPRSSRTR